MWKYILNLFQYIYKWLSFNSSSNTKYIEFNEYITKKDNQIKLVKGFLGFDKYMFMINKAHKRQYYHHYFVNKFDLSDKSVIHSITCDIHTRSGWNAIIKYTFNNPSVIVNDKHYIKSDNDIKSIFNKVFGFNGRLMFNIDCHNKYHEYSKTYSFALPFIPHEHETFIIYCYFSYELNDWNYKGILRYLTSLKYLSKIKEVATYVLFIKELHISFDISNVFDQAHIHICKI